MSAAGERVGRSSVHRAAATVSRRLFPRRAHEPASHVRQHSQQARAEVGLLQRACSRDCTAGAGEQCGGGRDCTAGAGEQCGGGRDCGAAGAGEQCGGGRDCGAAGAGEQCGGGRDCTAGAGEECGGSRCRGWLVVCACFGLSFLADGVASCFGVLLPELAAQIGATIADTAWAGSALCGGQLIAGPLVSALVNKLGCRPVVVFGSLMSSVAFSLSAAASEIGLFIFMYGILGGLGLGMMYLPSVVAVSLHFDTNRALATGIVVCGSGVGTFCLAPLTQHLLDVSGWRAAQLATAALLLTGTLMGSVMVEPSRFSEPCRARCCCYCCCSGPGHLSPESSRAEQPGAGGRGHTLTPGAPPSTAARERTPAESSAASPDEALLLTRERTPAESSAASSDEALLLTSAGTYLKLASPRPADSQPVSRPPLLFPPELLVESASSDSAAAQLDDSDEPLSPQAPELNAADQGGDPDRLLPAGAVHAETLCTSSLSPLLRSLPQGPPGSPRGLAFGRLRPVSGLFSPRPAISTPCQLAHTPHAATLVPPLQRPDVFFSGRVRPVTGRRRRAADPAEALVSPSSLPGGQQTGVQRRLALVSVGSADTVLIDATAPDEPAVAGDSFAVLREMLNVSLLRQTPFLLTCVGYSFSMLGYFVPIVFILDEAVQHGISAARASLLVAVMGASNTAGRLVVGVLSDLQHMDVLLLNNVCMLGSGLVALLFPLCQTYSAFAVVTSVFGLLSAANSTLSSLVLLEMVGLARLTNAFGLTLLFRGVAALLGTPLAGFLAEQTGGYDEPFYLTGALLITASGLGFLASGWGQPGCRQTSAAAARSSSYRRADSVDT